VGDRSPHQLPFLLAKGRIPLQQNILDEAVPTLRAAVRERPFLSSQRLLAIDTLARALSAAGDTKAATEVYAKGLAGGSPKTVFASASPAIFTNYAASLFKLGKQEEAKKQLDVALSIDGTDAMAAFLERKMAADSTDAAATRTREVLDMIDDVSRTIKESERVEDEWTTAPTVVLLLPFTNEAEALTKKKWILRQQKKQLTLFGKVQKKTL